MVQTQISLPENVMNEIKRDAAKLGVTPNVFMRIQLCTLLSEYGNEDVRKTYTITLEKWREVEAYITVKHPGASVGSFASKAIFSEMKKHGLNAAEKDEFDRLLGK
jgi:hypothetical protein